MALLQDKCKVRLGPTRVAYVQTCANATALHYTLNYLLFLTSWWRFNENLQAVKCNLNFLIYWSITKESKCYWFCE